MFAHVPLMLVFMYIHIYVCISCCSNVHVDYSCSVLLIDYGNVEENISSVLKIDPSVQKFAQIPSFADKYSLAFIKPVR